MRLRKCRKLLRLSTLFRLRISASAILAFTIPLAVAQSQQVRQPNIVFILADDLGYGDLSCYGQKRFQTPHIDRLAEGGMRFTAHYSGHNVCAPARCVLLSGKHPGHAYIRDNRGGLGPEQEGQEAVPAGELRLPLHLKGLGYRNGCFGKWGLGPVGSSGDPLAQGFDRFFGYNCQAQAHNYYPDHLWSNRDRVDLDNPKFAAHQKLPEGADPNDPASYTSYSGTQYAPDLIHAESLKFIRENQREPFFLFYSTTIPHLALQVPDDSLRPFLDKFPDEPYPGGRGYLPHRTPRAAYAAMITRLDAAIGELLDLVKELGLGQDTIFIFSSDNGPLYDRLGGTDSEFFNSAAGFRGRKGSFYEGGYRVPLLVYWPGRIAAGSRSDRVNGFEDWLPTLLELLGQPAVTPANSVTPADLDGISFAATLQGQTQAERPFLYRESPGYGGQQAVRVGDWKAIRRQLNPPRKQVNVPPTVTELYNLQADPGEQQDVASQHPEIVGQLEQLMQQQHTPAQLWPIRALDQPVGPPLGAASPVRQPSR